MNFKNEIAAILKGRSPHSDMGDVMEILGLAAHDFQKGFDIALEMQNQNLAKLLYSNFNANKIIIEFTLLAKSPA